MLLGFWAKQAENSKKLGGAGAVTGARPGRRPITRRNGRYERADWLRGGTVRRIIRYGAVPWLSLLQYLVAMLLCSAPHTGQQSAVYLSAYWQTSIVDHGSRSRTLGAQISSVVGVGTRGPQTGQQAPATQQLVNSSACCVLGRCRIAEMSDKLEAGGPVTRPGMWRPPAL